MKNFRFIEIVDLGPLPNGGACPHCGAEGRYIYKWESDGKVFGAMAGCYKALTGHLDKGEKERYIVFLAEKQAKNKKLNNWDKSIIRLLGFLKAGKYPEQWINQKITQVLTDRKIFLAEHHFLHR